MEGRKKEVFSLHKFLVVFRMLFREKSRLSFRSDLKGTLVKLTSLLVLFAVLIALSYGAYYLAGSFNIFSSVFYVPPAVPSIVMAFLLVFGFLSLLSGLRRSLFLSPDNKILLTYPCTGSTVFLARLAVYFVHELGRNFLVQFPLLLGYMMVMGAPGYLYPWLVFALAFLSPFEVMLASLLAIPYHLVASFLEERPRLKVSLVVLFFALLCSLFVALVLLVPDTVDIFTNWSYYSRLIQNFLNGYKRYLPPFYFLTTFLIGELTGYSYVAFSLSSLYVFLALLGATVLSALFAVYVLNPFYLRLSSSAPLALKKAKAGRKSQENRPLPAFLSALKKEALLLRGGQEKGLLSLSLAFLVLPFLALALGKFFHGMDLSSRGRYYVEVLMLLIFLLVSLASSSALSKSFTEEGMGYLLSRSYPRRSFFFILPKAVYPGILGTLSLVLSTVLYALFYGLDPASAALLSLSLVLFYLGTCLSALAFDFVHPSSTFLQDGSSLPGEKATTVLAFIVSAAATALFYLYRNEGVLPSYLKLLVLALIYAGVSAFLFYLKGRYEGKEEVRR